MSSDDGSALDSHTADPPLSSKERLLGHIRQNFYQETQCYQEQDKDGAHKEDKLQRVKRRCAKLERKLQEKDAKIQELQDRQQLQFPYLMHETMRSLRSLESNQSDDSATALPLSHSVISEMAHEKRDADARIHEYERQIAELYEENRQEKLKNEMLSECLREQKHAKAKLMKACKFAKQELQALKDSGLTQMLVDIEARCDALEKEKMELENELQAERSMRIKQDQERETQATQLEELLSECAKWEDIVPRKDQRIQESSHEICEQQQKIEYLLEDLKNAERRIARPPKLQEEIEQFKSAVIAERAQAETARQDLQKLAAENDMLRKHIFTRENTEDHPQTDAVDEFSVQREYEKVLLQVRFIDRRLCALTELIQTYENTNTIDIGLLLVDDGSGCLDPLQETSIRSCEENLMTLSGDIQKVANRLGELQQVVDDVCARSMGSTCALQ